jgi:hypothetical protein
MLPSGFIFGKVSGVRFQVSAVALIPNTLYETSPERNSEPQNRRISNRRILKGGFASVSFFLFYRIDRIPSFDIRQSIFIIRPARNALKRDIVKLNKLIHYPLIRLTRCIKHGRRVFAFLEFPFSIKLATFKASGGRDTRHMET